MSRPDRFCPQCRGLGWVSNDEPCPDCSPIEDVALWKGVLLAFGVAVLLGLFASLLIPGGTP